jgi:hypothetical protein
MVFLKKIDNLPDIAVKWIDFRALHPVEAL